jgi:hypothetical protein
MLSGAGLATLIPFTIVIRVAMVALNMKRR